MIIEQGRVMSVDDDVARVVCSRQASCERCARGEGCGGGILSLLLGDRLHEVEAAVTEPVEPGQVVQIGLDERVLLGAACIVYILPLLFLVGFALTGASLDADGSERYAIAFGISGLLAGFAWVRYYARRVRKNRAFRPVILGPARQRDAACMN